MSESFDPYHVWLGIPPYDQPPNHYRLLGLEAFEANGDAIANSAERQIAHLKSVATGRHAARAKTLIDEIRAASAVLLNEARKKAYDAKLQAEFRQYDLSVDAPASNALNELAKDDLRGRVSLLQSAQQELQEEENEREQQQVGYIYGVGGVIVVLAAIVIAVPVIWGLSSGGESEQASLDENGEGASPLGNQSAQPQSSGPNTSSSFSQPPTKGEAGPAESADGTLIKPGEKPKRDKSNPRASAGESQPAAELRTPGIGLGGLGGGAAPASGMPTGGALPGNALPGGQKPANALGGVGGPSGGLGAAVGGLGTAANKLGGEAAAQPGEADPEQIAKRDAILREIQRRRAGGAFNYQPPTPKPNAATPQNANSKTAPPSAEKLAKAEATVRSVYPDRFEKARSPVDRAQLAQFLLGQIGAVKDDDESRFLLLTVAHDYAQQAGRFRLAAQCLEQMDRGYEIDYDERMLKLVLDMGDRKSMPNDDRKQLVRSGVKSYAQLKAAKRYEEAREVAQIARSQALVSKDAGLRVEAQRIFGEANRLARLKSNYEAALETLKSEPDDGEANRAAGDYLCLVLEDWTRGLPHLAKAKSAALAAAAKQDLESPSTAEAMVELGDAWKAASQLSGNELYRVRALHWYQQAAPQLQGLARSALDRKIREVRDQ